MDNGDSDEDDDGCLCRAFVPKDKRVDFLAIRPNKKTGKPERTVVLRYHQDCPIHGINVKVLGTKPYNPNKPNRMGPNAPRTEPSSMQ